MTKLKTKSLELSKAKISEVDGERHIVFVASSSSEDRDYEVIEIGTFRLPLKGGGHIVVSDIPAAGSTDVDIPLLTDHDLFTVAKVIGSVRKATFENGELVFDCGISSRDYAQDVFKLVEEGHLDNSFSISFRDYMQQGDTITDGEIIEVSLVTRGSNPDARVLEVKGLKGEEVENETTEIVEIEKTEAEAPVEAVETKEVEVAETAPETEEAPVEAPKEESEEAEAEAESEESEAEEETPAEEESEKIDEEEIVEEELTNKENEMDEKIAKAEIVEKASQATTSVNKENYLSSKAALKDFTATVIANKGKSAKDVVAAWESNVAAKGITGDDILPTQISNIFFKTWTDSDSLLSTFARVNVMGTSVNAFTGEGEGIRAKGHKKGENKASQVIENIRRDLKIKVVYKMLDLDLQDLIDDNNGELIAFRAEELYRRVANEIVVGAILGDGRSSGTPDNRVFDGSRGLFSIKADLDAASSDDFAGAVASVVANASGDDTYAKIVKTISALNIENGQKAVVVVPKGTLASLLLTQSSTGAYMFPAGTNFGEIFNARIVELPEMTADDYEVIAYVEGQYALIGGEDMVRTSYDLNTNTDKMLVERAVAGSLFGNKVAAGYAAA